MNLKLHLIAVAVMMLITILYMVGKNIYQQYYIPNKEKINNIFMVFILTVVSIMGLIGCINVIEGLLIYLFPSLKQLK